MLNKRPPKEYQFPVNRQDHTKKGPYLTPLIKRFLEKKIKYIDPETNERIKGKVKDAILWRLILNSAQGDNEATKEILNRIDGKVADKTELSGEVKFTQMPAVKLGGKKLEVDVG